MPHPDIEETEIFEHGIYLGISDTTLVSRTFAQKSETKTFRFPQKVFFIPIERIMVYQPGRTCTCVMCNANDIINVHRTAANATSPACIMPRNWGYGVSPSLPLRLSRKVSISHVAMRTHGDIVRVR